MLFKLPKAASYNFGLYNSDIDMSQARLASCLPLPLDHKVLVNVIEKAKDWALMHGVGMRDKKHFNKDTIQVGNISI